MTSVCLSGAGGSSALSSFPVLPLPIMQPSPCSVILDGVKESGLGVSRGGGNWAVRRAMFYFSLAHSNIFNGIHTGRERLSQTDQRDSGWLFPATSLKLRQYLKSRASFCPFQDGESGQTGLTLSMSCEIGILTPSRWGCCVHQMTFSKGLRKAIERTAADGRDLDVYPKSLRGLSCRIDHGM